MSDANGQFGRIPYGLIDRGVVARLRSSDVRVLLILAAHADGEWVTRPGVSRIATLAGLSTRAVKRSLASLTRRGVVGVVERGGGRGHATVYQLAVKGGPGDTVSTERVTRCARKGCHGATERVTGRARKGGPGVTPTEENRREQKTEQRAPRSRRRGAVPHHRELVEFFCDEWRRRFGDGNGSVYPFTAGKDAAAVTAILKAAGGDLDRAKRLVRYFLDDDDGFLDRAGHSLGILRTRLPAYLEQATGVHGNGSKTRGGTASRPDLASDERYRNL